MILNETNKSCQENSCSCTNGTPRDNVCGSHGTENCTYCAESYHLIEKWIDNEVSHYCDTVNRIVKKSCVLGFDEINGLFIT